MSRWKISRRAGIKLAAGAGLGMVGCGSSSAAGEDDRSDINLTFLQPFVGFTWTNAVSLFLNTETQIDWENEEESVPLNLTLSRVRQIGGETFSFGGGITYWADSPDNGPEDFGGRFTITWLIPKS